MAHRRAVVFLHEWAHTLGAVHTRDLDVVMAPSYSTRIRGFGPAALGVGLAALDVMPPRGPADDTWFEVQRQAVVDGYTAHRWPRRPPARRAITHAFACHDGTGANQNARAHGSAIRHAGRLTPRRAAASPRRPPPPTPTNHPPNGEGSTVRRFC